MCLISVHQRHSRQRQRSQHSEGVLLCLARPPSRASAAICSPAMKLVKHSEFQFCCSWHRARAGSTTLCSHDMVFDDRSELLLQARTLAAELTLIDFVNVRIPSGPAPTRRLGGWRQWRYERMVYENGVGGPLLIFL